MEKKGVVLVGRYEIKSMIGSGEFSDIYQVSDRFGSGDQIFAVKIARKSDFNFIMSQVWFI